MVSPGMLFITLDFNRCGFPLCFFCVQFEGFLAVLLCLLF